MPEKQNTVRIAAHEARAVHHVSKAFQHGVEQQIVLLGIVFQISILNNEIVAGRPRNARVQRCALTLVDLVLDILEVQIRVCRPVSQNGFLRIVAGAIIHNNQLFFNALRQAHRSDLIEYQMNRLPLIVSGNNDGKLSDSVAHSREIWE